LFLPTILAVEGVYRKFGSVVAADDINMAVAEGEAVGIIGPNGAGKTTLFNIIAGSMRPSAGRVMFCGRDITALRPGDRCRAGIGRSHQIPHPFAGMSVFENMLVGATFGAERRGDDAYARCVAILDRLGLLAKANHLAGSLTLLDRKRLEMARALATEPRLLLLDEIAGGLTEGEVRQLIDTIVAVRATGVSILWIEHIVHALISVVNRLIAMHFGRVLADGQPVAVMASPEVQEVYLGIEEP
jgi:branched-chain amino acid transport system ATP-binding protein